jgi:hypothetical protein
VCSACAGAPSPVPSPPCASPGTTCITLKERSTICTVQCVSRPITNCGPALLFGGYFLEIGEGT